MRKVISLSVNENPAYLFYLPLTCWAWQKLGWRPFLFSFQVGQRTELSKFVNEEIHKQCNHWTEIITIPDGYRSETWAQISRLYAACHSNEDDYILTGDCDMLPLSDYWQIDPESIGIWGHDLTEYQQMPICYLGMMAPMWKEVMALNSNDSFSLMKRDLDGNPNAKSSNFEQWWSLDQQIITDRINASALKKKNVSRGTDQKTRYPIGRVDRSAWTLEHPKFIDCHMLRDIYSNPDHLAKTLLLLYKVWPNENFAWFTEYTNEFSKLISK